MRRFLLFFYNSKDRSNTNKLKKAQNAPPHSGGERSISLAILTSLETSGQPLSAQINEKIDSWGLFEKMSTLHFCTQK